MAVVRRTLLVRTNSHVCTGHSGSLGSVFPLKQIGTPKEIARLAVHLLSDAGACHIPHNNAGLYEGGDQTAIISRLKQFRLF